MRKARALLRVVVLILPVLASHAAWAQGAQPRLVTIRDAETESLVRAFANPLFRAAGVDPALVRITLLQAWAINAFVATGNRLYLHTGLIQQAESAAEFAGVLAHETGHIAGGHLSRLPEEIRAAMIRAIVAMLLGGAAAAASGRGDAAAAIALGGQQAALRGLYAFTRSQEQAADQAGITYLERNRWPAGGLARLLERLMEQENLRVARQEDAYLQTHPLSRDRLEFIREQVARSPYPDAALPAQLETRYAMVRAKLDGFLDAPRITMRRYPESDASAPARYARAIAQFRSGRLNEALALLETLLREQPSNPYLHEIKGQFLFEGGRPRDSLGPYRDAARLAPLEPLIRLSYARALIEAGGDAASLRLAVAELEASLARERDSAFAWHQLAVAQGRLGQTALAELAMAEEAILNQDFPEARFRARRAEEALPAGPARNRATDLRYAARRENMTPEERRTEDERRRGGRN